MNENNSIYTSPAYAGLVSTIALHVEGLNDIGNLLAEIAMSNEGVLPRGFCSQLAKDTRVSKSYISQLVSQYGFSVTNSNGTKRKADKRSAKKSVSRGETEREQSAVDLTAELFNCLASLKASGITLNEVIAIIKSHW